MKRLITSLSVLLLCTSARADAFGPNDKVLYFNSETLIAVIKDTFPQNLQLDVANKYVELMDDKGNVSIDDLRTVCGVGQLDNAKCKNFIRDLIDTMGDDTIKPFYWADYVTVSPEPIRLAVFSSGDGNHHHSGLDKGEWAITFGWMKELKFMRQYPQTKYIRGMSACTNESGTKNVADTSKNFTLNEQTGEQCWCKMIGPEESAWVYNTDKSSGVGGNCARSCALECISALRTEPMRSAMFTAVKLNGSNANTNDEKVIGDALKNEFKPCEFDWENDTYWESLGEMDLVEGLRFWGKFRPREPMDQWFVDSYKDSFSYSLKDWEWEAGGSIPWLTSKKFKCVYPNVKTIKGTATINNKKPKSKMWLSVTQDSFSARQINGGNCWCKMTYPEESAWVWIRDFDEFPDLTYTDTERYNMCIGGCGYIFSRYSDQIIDAFRPIGKK